MVAYAALVSLLQTLDTVIEPGGPPVAIIKSQLRPLREKVTYLLDAAALMVKFVALRFLTYHGLRPVIFNISCITEEVIKIKEARGTAEQELVHRNVLSRRDPTGSGKNVVVGFDTDLIEMMTRLTSASPKMEIVSIVGMGGIGKTTLAREAYHEYRSMGRHFDTCAWVTISQEYKVRQVLVGLLETAGKFTEEMSENEDEQLSLCLYQSLKHRRYLIVLDDIWDAEIWDAVKMSFPEDNNGSRVVLTTRLASVALYACSLSSIHQMRFLNQEESWKLLCSMVFRGEFCPRELEGIGEKITQKCGGLPLAIVVVGGLLSKVSRETKTWESVADNLSSIVTKDEEQCMEILSLSYSHLPYHLRACFLYMGVFPEDYEISVPILVRLWNAEGFLRPSQGISPEELAEEYLEDLIGRNLMLVCMRGSNGKIKRCSIHDLIRSLCIQNARREKFIRIINYNDFLDHRNSYRILSARHNSIFPKSGAHSYLYTGIPFVILGAERFSLGDTYRMLRVLDLLMLTFVGFPNEMMKLVNLRYLALTFDDDLRPSISNLSKLLTLVCHVDKDSTCPNLPVEIWMMPNLRHVFVTRAYLPHPNLDSDSYTLQNLQALGEIRNFKCCKNILRRIPNLKQLKLSYYVSHSENWSVYKLEALIHLRELESLKLSIKYHDAMSEILYPPKLAFPHKLRKLTLCGCGIPWGSTNMMIVGDLKSLQVLKLRRNACRGSTWKPVEGQFCRLKYLLLEEIDLVEWEADESHFPLLEHLVIRSCYELEEIPSAIGDIPTLQMIELVDCNPRVVASAKQLQEEQESMGNDELEVVYSEQRLNSKYYYSVFGQKIYSAWHYSHR